MTGLSLALNAFVRNLGQQILAEFQTTAAKVCSIRRK
jgi:hypothetical protein